MITHEEVEKIYASFKALADCGHKLISTITDICRRELDGKSGKIELLKDHDNEYDIFYVVYNEHEDCVYCETKKGKNTEILDMHISEMTYIMYKFIQGKYKVLA